LPTQCVVNSSQLPENAAVQLFLPIPPYYPDEVRARIWAQGRGYRMAPPTVCSAGSARAAVSSGSSSTGTSGNVGSSGPAAPANSQYHITSPSPGQQVNGLVAVMGSAEFNPAQIQYYKLEIGQGASPSEWTTFGTTHSQPVSNGLLEQLHADALPPGQYIIRLILVGQDGNFAGPPYQVPISIGS